MQTAYEVLSDTHERAWYDSHRESILRGVGEEAGTSFKRGVRFSDARDVVGLMGQFNASISFNDEPHGFFSILSAVFAELSAEEEAACSRINVECVDYPKFGSYKDEFVAIKPFYQTWQNFSTKKSFSWKDLYAPPENADRATRRLVEKENNKAREHGIRDFNDAVRHLVIFVRKRDPRWTPNSAPPVDMQIKLRDAAAAQAAKSRAAYKAKITNTLVPSWQIPSALDFDTEDKSSESSLEIHEIHCVACRKAFKSEQQFEAHERSKKHKKNIQQIQRQMQTENEILGLGSLEAPMANDHDHDLDQLFGDIDQSVHDDSNRSKDFDHGKDKARSPSTQSSVRSNEGVFEGNDMHNDGPHTTLEPGTVIDPLRTQKSGTIEMSLKSLHLQPSAPKIGKAKLKRARKAAQGGLKDSDESQVRT